MRTRTKTEKGDEVMETIMGIILVLLAGTLLFVFALHLLLVVMSGVAGVIKGFAMLLEKKPALKGKKFRLEEIPVIQPA